MIWTFLTLLISAINLYAGYKINPKLNKGLRIFNPNDTEAVLGVIVLSLIPVLNIIMLIRISLLSLTNLYLNNYDY